jgi:hypothetical protein
LAPCHFLGYWVLAGLDIGNCRRLEPPNGATRRTRSATHLSCNECWRTARKPDATNCRRVEASVVGTAGFAAQQREAAQRPQSTRDPPNPIHSARCWASCLECACVRLRLVHQRVMRESNFGPLRGVCLGVAALAHHWHTKIRDVALTRTAASPLRQDGLLPRSERELLMAASLPRDETQRVGIETPPPGAGPGGG